ncbi:GNAT family N-acetyltransferase [Streptomyces halobius]|uniref:N-acetyltransferase domain-containing protein n=1 Tax=Streptomyces halobius TaxID=2879846 RepID=A0ABY4MIV4_9ACTN|nr:GNAT family N-acetyltransferase [Streptomyces halobius]UQA97488.1 hypothetical protein K9S39_41595 [Streptomyces halobius]
MDVGPANPDDAVALALAELTNQDLAGPWFAELHAHIADGLTTGTTLAAYVVDNPAGGLAACALGSIHQGLPGPGYNGRTGHIHLVVTAPAFRHRGYATAVTTASCNAASRPATGSGLWTPERWPMPSPTARPRVPGRNPRREKFDG